MGTYLKAIESNGQTITELVALTEADIAYDTSEGHTHDGSNSKSAEVGEHAHAGGGADVKSGVIGATSDGATGSVTYATPFSGAAHVALTLMDAAGGLGVDVLVVTAYSNTGFSWELFKGHGGGNHSWDGILWFATDIGDP